MGTSKEYVVIPTACFTIVLTPGQLNILMGSSDNAVIADFGLATVTQNLDSIRSAPCQHGHTARWTAPELLNEGTYSKETDIFSFAMVMIEVRHGCISKFLPDRLGLITPCLARYGTIWPDELHPARQGVIRTLNGGSGPLHSARYS